jgi:hypothetical protein
MDFMIIRLSKQARQGESARRDGRSRFMRAASYRCDERGATLRSRFTPYAVLR